MRGYHKRRSPLKTALWCGAFLTLTFVLAWQFQWLPGSGKTESPIDPGSNLTSDGKSVSPDANINNSDGAPFDPTVFDSQSEPGGRDVSMPKVFGAPDKITGGRTTGPLRKQNLIDDVNVDDRRKRSEIHFSRNGSMSTTGNRVAANTTNSNVPSRPSSASHIKLAGFQQPTPAVDSSPPPATLQKIDALIRADETRIAHKQLSQIYWKKPEWRNAILRRIEGTAKEIYFDRQHHFMPAYEVKPGDQLRTVAKKYHVTYQYLERLNGINARRIRPGMKLKVIKGPFSAVVDLKTRELTIHHFGYFVAKYPVGVGKDGKTPVGKHKVDGKLVNPKYYGTDERTGRQFTIKADDPANPLGERWISIGDSYGIHGTIDPKSIGKAMSRGCVRMHNADVEWVYDFLTVGSDVIIRK